jgi:glutathione S-transferase
MIELHQYPAVWGLPSLSPFCIKAEIYLRHHEIPYRVIEERNPARGPKGKMPFIVDSTSTVADSTFILQHLEKTRGISSVSSENYGVCTAYQRLLEESLYFVLLYSRWVDPRGWAVLKSEFTPLFPPLLGAPILGIIRHQLKRQAFEQGISRHTREEVYRIGRNDLAALSQLLGEKKYFLGEEFSALDASAYGFLITILRQPIETELKATLKNHKNLLLYCKRLEAEYFPELAEIQT